MKLYKFYLLILMPFLFSCSVQNQKIKNKTINTKINEEYRASIKAFHGKLNEVEYKEVRELILTELKTKVPEKKAILINFYQNGNNCHEYGLSERDSRAVIKNSITISESMSNENNAEDFFVFTADCLHKDKLENVEGFILDSGFFTTNFFTLKENCRAFFILKPNGEFLKYYGSDYYSEVQYFLQIK